MRTEAFVSPNTAVPVPAARVDGRSPTLGGSPALGAQTDAVRAEFGGGRP